MSLYASSLKPFLDNVTRFEQGRYEGDPADLAKKTRLRIEQDVRDPLSVILAYSELLPDVGTGLRLLEQAAELNQTLLSQKRTPSTFERLVNRVFDFAKYVFWTIPSSAYHWVASSLTGRKWHQADPIDQGPVREISLNSVYKQLFSYEENKGYFKVFSLEKEEPPYEPTDLDQVVADINTLSQLLSFKPCDFLVLNRLTFRVVQLQLHHSNFAYTRLDQVRSIIAKLFESLVEEMKSSSFFQEGVEDEEHLKKVITLLDTEDISKRSQEKVKELSLFDYTSVPIANDSVNNTGSIDTTRVSITDAEWTLKVLASKAQAFLWEVLTKQQLRINDSGWVNRERGIPNFLNWTCAPNPTLEERLTSVLSGLVVLEYLKRHELALKDFAKNLFDYECEQLERNTYLQLQNSAPAPTEVTLPSRPRPSSSEIKEAALEAVIQELLHLSLASTTTLIRPNPKYLTDQMVSSFITLAHKAADPKQENQVLKVLALASRSLLQLHMTAGSTSLLAIGTDCVKSMLLRCGISTVFGYSTTKPSEELQSCLGGLIHTGLTKNDSHFVSAGLFLLTSKMNDFLQEKARELSTAGYRESALWMSRLAAALKTDLSVNAALTDTITTRRRALEEGKKESKSKSSDDEPEVEEDELSPSDCEEECQNSKTDRADDLDEERTDHLMEEPKVVPLSCEIEEHHPYNGWLGKHSKEPDYVTVTINGEKSKLPDRKSAEAFVQLMQDQQRLVHQGNDQVHQAQQRALYLGKPPSEIPQAQTQEPHSYKVTYDTKKGETQVFVDGSSKPSFSEKNSKAAKHALRYIQDHINGHNSYIQNKATSYTSMLTADLPPHIAPPKNPEYVYHVHKANDTFTAYASPINGLGAPRNLGEFTSRKEANNWTTMNAGHTAQTQHLKDVMFEAQAA